MDVYTNRFSWLSPVLSIILVPMSLFLIIYPSSDLVSLSLGVYTLGLAVLLVWFNCYRTCQSVAFNGNEISFKTLASQRTMNWQDVKEIRLYRLRRLTTFKTPYGNFSAPITFARRAELIQHVETKAAEMAVPLIIRR